MEDNIEMLVMNMNNVFRDMYFNTFETEDQSTKILKSAQTIISANMSQGDALTRKTATGKPIIFSEWKPIGKNKVQRTEYTFDSIVEGGGPLGSVQKQYEQMDLFTEDNSESNDENVRHYLPVKWEDIYKRLVE